MMHPRHLEQHRTERTGWFRAAVLGANDGIVSIAFLGGVAIVGAGDTVTDCVPRAWVGLLRASRSGVR